MRSNLLRALTAGPSPNHPGWRRLCQSAMDVSLESGGHPAFAVAHVGTGLRPWGWYTVATTLDPLDQLPPVFHEHTGRAMTRERAYRAGLRAAQPGGPLVRRASAYRNSAAAFLGGGLHGVAVLAVVAAIGGMVAVFLGFATGHGALTGQGAAALALGVAVAALALFLDERLRAAHGFDR